MSAHKVFSREQLLAGATIAKEFVPLGGDDQAGVWVRGLTPREWSDFTAKAQDDKFKDISDSILIAQVAMTADGQRIFTDEDVPEIAKMLGLAAQRTCVKAILILSGISKEQIEATEKN